MARYTESKCRICRREGTKLFLKGDRCYTDKCAYERRAYPPGEHGRARKKHSDYAIQLREKQKVRRMYGLLEGQFRKYFDIADSRKGATGENLLILLEKRLDNVVYRLGFANSRIQARQLVRHNHIAVNGRRVNIPSYIVKEGDVVSVLEKSKKMLLFQEAQDVLARRGAPGWVDVDGNELKGTIKATPVRDDITFPINEQLIVELYSK
ncbi:30S ribosomal protein S4 [Desulfonatronovibrio magnus]|uniref:30S ribosomal protein S4 n=1 Tax=Desulfonatronovibrio magnus TaxID=698827 RepID=UPI0005EAF2C9|nr:30S ribosomal protein S4 [Desulfonatronovibrio magnus]